MPSTIKTISLSTAGPSPVLTLLDQRVLPSHTTYIHLHTAAETAAAIKDMVVRGAPAIGCTAAYGFYLAAFSASTLAATAFDFALDDAYTTLAASRPTAVNLVWALDRLRALNAGLLAPPPAVAAAILAEAHAIAEQDVAACKAMGAHALTLLPRPDARFIHHCNTGSLATFAYGTALGVIRAAHAADPRVFVYVDETRPRLQGARLTAWECVQEGIAHTVMADSCAAVVMAQGKVDVCVVGSDRIAGDGSVANKIGTYALAICAKFHSVPFIVVAPTSTVDLACATGADIPIEERHGDEVSFPCGSDAPRVTPAESDVFNPAFDITPPELVSYIVTENGIAKNGSFGEDLKRLVAISEAKTSGTQTQ